MNSNFNHLTRALQKYVDRIKEFASSAPKLPENRTPIKQLTIWKDRNQYGISYINILGNRSNNYVQEDVFENLLQIGCEVDDGRMVLSDVKYIKCYATARDTMINWVSTKVVCLVLQPSTDTPALIYDIPYEQLYEYMEKIFTVK